MAQTQTKERGACGFLGELLYRLAAWLRHASMALALCGAAASVDAAVSISKEFVLPPVADLDAPAGQTTNNQPFQGDVRTVRLGISQVGNAITGGRIVDQLPPQILLANPINARFSSGCGIGAVASGAPGSTAFVATGLEVPAGNNLSPGRCFVYFDVVSTQAGNWINTIAANPSGDSAADGFSGVETGIGPTGNGQASSRNLTVVALSPLAVSKSFTPSTILMGAISTINIQINNPNGASAFNLTQLTEALPANVVAETTVPTVVCSAGGSSGTASASGTSGTVTISLAGTSVAAGGSCTVSWQVRGVVQNGSQSTGTNTIPANSVGNDRGVGSTQATANVTVQSPIAHAKSFNPNPARANEPITLTVDVTNRSAAAVTAVSWTDALPGDMRIASAPVVTNCGAGSASGTVGTASLALSNADIAAGATCRVTLTVTANTVQTYSNSTSGASWTQGGNSATTSPATASVSIFSGFRGFKSILDFNGQPINGGVAPGDVIRFRIELENFADGQITNVSVTDRFPAAGGAQVVYATSATPGASNPRTNCTPTGNPQAPGPISAPATAQSDGASVVTFTGLVVPGNPDGNASAGTRCFIEFDALIPRTWPVGTQISNSLAPGDVGGGTLENNVVANVPTVNQFQLFKSFNPATVSAGDVSVVTLTLANNGFFALTNVELDDPLPLTGVNGIAAQLVVANPASLSTTCGGSPVLTISPGRDRVQASGITVPARLSGQVDNRCTVSFRVRAPLPTTYNNQATAPSATDSRTGTAVPPPPPAAATLTATPSLTASKAFSPTPVSASGGVSRVTITVGNIGNGQLTGVFINDPLPASLRVASPANASTTCGGPVSVSAAAGAANSQLSGAVLPAGTSCAFRFDVVTSGAPNPVTNSIPAGNIGADGGVVTTTPVTADVGTFGGGAVPVQKSFAPTDLQGIGQPSRLTISFANVSTQALTGLALTDVLPLGMIVASPANATTTCGGAVVTAAPGSSSVSISGGSVPAGSGAFPPPANATCAVSVDVTLRRSGTAINTIPAGAVRTDQALTNTDQTVANLSALATIGVLKRFDPTAVTPNTPARLVITVLNSAGIDFNNLRLVDPLPAGLAIASPANASTSCGGGTVATRPSTLGGGRIDVVLSSGSLPGSSTDTTSCDVAIDVVAAVQGAYLNTLPTGNVQAAGGISNSAPASATLNVRAAATLSKAFANFNRRINEDNPLTITITNPNSVALTNVALTDIYPAGVFNSTAPNASTNCGGGVVTATPNSGFVRLTSATVPANGSCTISVTVLANTVGVWNNLIADGALTSAEGITNPAPAAATFVTLDPPTLGKEFLPVQITSGGTSKLRIVLLNTNSVALALAAPLIDTLPAGLSLGAPALDTTTVDPQGKPRCANTSTSGGNTITVASGTALPAGGCVVWANVTGTVVGQYLNSIPAGALQTQAGPNALPATATLSISTQVSISGKVFRDADNNGLVGASDIGIAGQTVELLNSVGSVLASTLTDSLGNYAFVDLPADTYSVRQPAQPLGTLNGITSAPSGAASAGTATTPTVTPSQISTIVLTAGQNAQNANFAEIAPASIAGRVFLDNNFDGLPQAGDAPISGVSITLTGTNDLGQPVSLATSTDAAGSYSFGSLRPSSYTLTQPAQPPNTANGITTAGVGVTSPGSATTPATLPSAISGIGIAPGQNGTGFNFAEVPLAAISGTVYIDRDRNNSFDPTDVGRIAGVTIRLVQGADCISGTTLQTTTTDANGNYRFGNLAAGANFLICQTQPAGWGNGNANGVPGSNVIPVTALPAVGLGGNNFGEIGATVSGSVFLDGNNDGVRNGSDTGLAAVQVTLTGADLNGVSITSTASSDGSGNYTVFDLPQGSYTVTQQLAQPVVAGTPTLNGRTTAGTISGATVGTATPVTTVPSAVSGIVLPAAADSINNNFAEILPVAISGAVFFDNNADGQRNGTDVGIAAQTIVITGTDDLGQAVTRTLTTSSNGDFSAPDLRPGIYTITQPTQPPGSANGQTTAGVAGGTATATTTLPSAISGIVLTTPGANAPNNLFAELPLGSSIAGRVWLDANNNGLIEASEAPLANVAIELVGTDGVGNAVTRGGSTDAAGNYSFFGLPQGNFTVRQPLQPPATVNGRTVAGSLGGAATAVTTLPSAISGIVLPANTAASNYNFGELPAASISGAVYNDTNNNGQRDPGEGGFANQSITLTGTDDLGNAVNLTLTTAADGSFIFGSLRPGTYTLTQPSQPPNTVPGRTTAGSLGGVASPVGPGPSTITTIVVPIGGVSSGNLFGEIGNSPDVVASKLAEGTFATGNRATYRISVANVGQVSTSGVVRVEDRLPPGLTLAVTPTGTGWSCSGAAGDARFVCTSSSVIAAGAVNSNTIAVSVNVAPGATGNANSVVLDNALLVEGGGELPAYAPTPNDRTLFETNPAGLPVCATPPAQNACRTPTTVLRSASASGTAWYDIGTATRQLDSGDQRLGGWIVEVVDADAPNSPVVRRLTTNADGTWRADDLIPGRTYQVRFRDPQSTVVFGQPVSGEQGTPPVPCVASNPGNANRSSCVDATDLRIVLLAGDNLVQQSLPLVPGGLVYDAVSRNPVQGATVALAPVGSCPGFNPATSILNASGGGYSINGNAISMTVGALGAYYFGFAATAPAACQFTLTVTPPPTHSFPSLLIPPQTAAFTPPPNPGTSFVQQQPNAPVGSASTVWYGTIGAGASLQPIVNNHIPLDPRSVAGIVIIKTGSAREVELGDSLQYAIRIRNNSTFDRAALYIDDRLPAGFRYIPGTARVERNGASVAIADPAGGLGPNLTFAVGGVAAGSDITLSYRVRVGVGAQQGDGINRAQAKPLPTTDCRARPAECSNEARWTVKVTAGVFTTEACILGKVFVDCNGNHVQDGEELGVPGVRLYLQSGRFAITDSEGKYSMCGIPPRTQVIKVDPLTLPRGSRLTTSSNRNAGDANSLFADLKNGELHRADFIEGSCSNPVLEQVKARRTQGEVSAPQTERRGSAPLRLQGKDPAAPRQATDSANQQPAVRPRPEAPSGTLPSQHENDTPVPLLPMNQPPAAPSAPAGGAR
jgi:uncharacterized repeat protein (TIGR01451 family)